MARHNEIGKEGGELAVQYLIDKQWVILERNWRSGHKEVDIIAERNGYLIIVEVKVRKFIGNERIEEHIPRNKQQHLIHAANAYLKYRNLDMGVRFDIILITGDSAGRQVEHIENAFSPWD
jgi:putative endonuclease